MLRITDVTGVEGMELAVAPVRWIEDQLQALDFRRCGTMLASAPQIEDQTFAGWCSPDGSTYAVPENQIRLGLAGRVPGGLYFRTLLDDGSIVDTGWTGSSGGGYLMVPHPRQSRTRARYSVRRTGSRDASALLRAHGAHVREIAGLRGASALKRGEMAILVGLAQRVVELGNATARAVVVASFVAVVVLAVGILLAGAGTGAPGLGRLAAAGVLWLLVFRGASEVLARFWPSPGPASVAEILGEVDSAPGSTA